MAEILRRDLLAGTAAAALSAALGSFAAAQPQPPQPAAAAYRFFTPEEASFVEAAVDRLIPPDPDWPGARALDVPAYIDLQLAGPYGNGERLYLDGPVKPGLPSQGYQLGLSPAGLYRTSLKAILTALSERNLDFTRASAEEQDEFLKRLEAGEMQIEGFSSAIFFETLLANTIEGFFADPAYGGNKDMAAWRMIGFPGAYAAYLDLYTQHGLRFDREPLSMIALLPDDHGGGPLLPQRASAHPPPQR